MLEGPSAKTSAGVQLDKNGATLVSLISRRAMDSLLGRADRM
jgi:hypothetical protein